MRWMRGSSIGAAAVAAFALFTVSDGGATSPPDPTPATRPEASIHPPRDLVQALEDTGSDMLHVYTAPARMTRSDLLWTGGVLAVAGLLYANDGDLYDALKRNEFESGYKWLRDAGEFFEPLGFQGFLNKYLIGSMIVGYFARIDLLRQVPADMLESFIISQIGKEAANQLIGRNGPQNDLGPRSFEDGRSLPSGHSLTVTTVATVLSHHIRYKPFQIGIHAVAGTVLLQRVTSDHHWPSDVLLGAAFGYAVTKITLNCKEARRLEIAPTIVPGGGIGIGIRAAF